MIEFLMFSAVCLAIFVLAISINKQAQTKSLQPIRIETEEEIRRKQQAIKRRERDAKYYRD